MNQQMDRLSAFHKAATERGNRLGTLEQFRTAMGDSTIRSDFYTAFSQENKIGTVEQFGEAMGPYAKAEVPEKGKEFVPTPMPEWVGEGRIGGGLVEQVIGVPFRRLVQSVMGAGEAGYRLWSKISKEDPEKEAIVLKNFEQVNKSLEYYKGDPEGWRGYLGRTIGELIPFIAEMRMTGGALQLLGVGKVASALAGRVKGVGRLPQVIRSFVYGVAQAAPTFAIVEGTRELGPVKDRANKALHGLWMGLVFPAVTSIPGGIFSPGMLVRVPLGNYALGTNPVETIKILRDETIPSEEKIKRVVDTGINSWFVKFGWNKNSLIGLHREISKHYWSRGKPVPEHVTKSLKELGDVIAKSPSVAGAEEFRIELRKPKVTPPLKEAVERGMEVKVEKKAVEEPPLKEGTVEELERLVKGVREEAKAPTVEYKDWERKFIASSKKTAETEKKQDRVLTQEERDLMVTDWKKFSEERGYTKQEIADYGKWLALEKEGRKKFGLSSDDTFAISGFATKELPGKLLPEEITVKIAPEDRKAMEDLGYSKEEIAEVKTADDIVAMMEKKELSVAEEKKVEEKLPKKKTFVKGKVTKLVPKDRPKKVPVSPAKEIPPDQMLEPSAKVRSELRELGYTEKELDKLLPTLTKDKYVELTGMLRKSAEERKVEKESEEVYDGEDAEPKGPKKGEEGYKELRLGEERMYGGGPSWEDIKKAFGEMRKSGLRVEGYARDLKKKTENVLDLMAEPFDVERPYVKRGWKETGFAVKNLFTTEETISKMAIRDQRILWEMQGKNKEDMIDIPLARDNVDYMNSLSSERRAELKPGQEFFGKWLDSHLEILIKKGGLKQGFKQNRLDFFQKEYDKALKEGDRNKQKEFAEAIDAAEKVEFVPILMSWFDEHMDKDPRGAATMLRVLARRKRKTLSIKDLLDEGVLKREDIDAREIILNYGRRAGHDIAVLDIANAAISEGAASKRPKIVDGVKYIKSRIPVLRGYYLHPHLNRMLQDLSDISRRGWIAAGMTNTMSTIKMAAFYNPLFLPGYDLTQHIMLTGLEAAIPVKGKVLGVPIIYPKMFKYMKEAIHDITHQTDTYWKAREDGLPSKPFSSPLNTYKKMRDRMLMTKGEWIASQLDRWFPLRVLDNLYQLSWSTAWTLDEGVRMMSYRYLLDKGLTSREAAQTAAMFHSDYASVPPGTRRALNYVFFTPTFKITMGKLYLNMIKGAIDYAERKEPTSVTRRYAMGAVYTAAISQGFDMLMNSLGYRTDQWGRRYVKEIIGEDGRRKELVLTWSAPANMFLKYIYRVQEAMKPGVENPFAKFAESMKWEFHPLWRVINDIKDNKSEDYGYIYHPFDPPIMKVVKGAEYFVLKTMRLLEFLGGKTGVIAEDEVEAEANKRFREDTYQLFGRLTEPFTFKYVRGTAEERVAYRLKDTIDRFAKLTRRPETFPNAAQMEEFLEQIRKIKEDLEGRGVPTERVAGP